MRLLACRAQSSSTNDAASTSGSRSSIPFLSSSRFARVNLKQRSRLKELDRVINRLERKLYDSEQKQQDDGDLMQQIVRARLLDDMYERRERLEDMDLSRPEVGESRAHAKAHAV